MVVIFKMLTTDSLWLSISRLAQKEKMASPNIYGRRILISQPFSLQFEFLRYKYCGATCCIVFSYWGLWAWWRVFRIGKSRNMFLVPIWYLSVWSCVIQLTIYCLCLFFFKREGICKKHPGLKYSIEWKKKMKEIKFKEFNEFEAQDLFPSLVFDAKCTSFNVYFYLIRGYQKTQYHIM